MPKIYVFGSMNTDLSIIVDAMPKRGETKVGHGFFINSGGKGANQAVAAAKLGLDVSLIGAVGKDEYGNRLLKVLRQYNVKTKNVKKIRDVNTGLAFVMRSNGDNRIIIEGGANQAIVAADIKKALRTANKGDILITQLESPINLVFETLKCAKEKAMITLFNPAPAQKLDNAFYEYIDYLIINETETVTLSNIKPTDEKAWREVHAFFKTKGVKSTVITLGDKGSVIINDHVTFHASYDVNALDTTAAGDAFIGALAYQITAEATDYDKLCFANAMSALTCLKEGAQRAMPNLNEVLHFLNSDPKQRSNVLK